MQSAFGEREVVAGAENVVFALIAQRGLSFEHEQHGFARRGMSKAESGKMELHPEPYYADDFRGYIDAVIRPLCEGKHQTLEFAVHTLDNVVPKMDVLRMNQIYFNLLSNAVKYTPEGGRIQVEVNEQITDQNKDRMTVSVRDNGIGMGGTIRVSSALGKGTTFLLDFTLDCIPVSQMNQDRAAAEAEKGTVNLAGRHLLICEDHPLNQEIVKMMLEEKQALVTAVSDGQEGVRAFQGSSLQYFDCILMDIHMPVMDGYEAARTIRALQRPDAAVVPIIAMTADAFQDDVQKCLNAGMMNSRTGCSAEALGSASSRYWFRRRRLLRPVRASL